jgi:hypothetical protein
MQWAIDRETLAMRHIKQLANNELAQFLDIL